MIIRVSFAIEDRVFERDRFLLCGFLSAEQAELNICVHTSYLVKCLHSMHGHIVF